MPTTSSRLLALLSLLQSTRDWSGDLLADRLAVSTRTVRRDVERLRDLGYRITTTKGPDGGYRLDAGARLPPLLFDEDQAAALAVALRLLAGSGTDLGDAALRALTTVQQVMPPRVRHRVEALPVLAVEPPGAPRGEVPTATLVALGAAVHARQGIRFDYGEEESAPPRRAEPHHLVSWRGRWYVVAWDLDRDDWRTFRADRLRLRNPGGARFAPREVPGGDPAAFVVSRFRGGDGSTGWPCRGEAEVGLPLADVAPYAGDGTAEAVGPERTRLRLGAWSWPALAAAYLRFDADLGAVAPAELREAFGALARRAGEASDSPGGGA